MSTVNRTPPPPPNGGGRPPYNPSANMWWGHRLSARMQLILALGFFFLGILGIVTGLFCRSNYRYESEIEVTCRELDSPRRLRGHLPWGYSCVIVSLFGFVLGFFEIAATGWYFISTIFRFFRINNGLQRVRGFLRRTALTVDTTAHDNSSAAVTGRSRSSRRRNRISQCCQGARTLLQLIVNVTGFVHGLLSITCFLMCQYRMVWEQVPVNTNQNLVTSPPQIFSRSIENSCSNTSLLAMTVSCTMIFLSFYLCLLATCSSHPRRPASPELDRTVVMELLPMEDNIPRAEMVGNSLSNEEGIGNDNLNPEDETSL